MPASPIEMKNSLPDLDLNPGRQDPSARQRFCGDSGIRVPFTGSLTTKLLTYVQ